MSNSTLVPPQHYMFSSQAMEAAPRPEMRSFARAGVDGGGDVTVLEMKNVAVFRSGTFRDSMGDQSTWTRDDLEMFVQNFNHLTASGTLPDVPVRKGHRSYSGTVNMDGLIGYVTGLRVHTAVTKVSQEEYSFLVADYEILDPIAQEKVKSGLWRNRSAEVGGYLDNNDVLVAPAFMGFAYVDMPAVERLNEYENQAGNSNFTILMEEVMPNAPKPTVIPTDQVAQFSIGGVTTSDYAQVQAYIGSLETANTELTGQVTAFQAKVAELEKAEKDREFASRAEKVAKLVDDGKLLAPQKDATVALAATMSAEQFAAWHSIQEGAQPVSLLQPHGEQPQGDGTPENQPKPSVGKYSAAEKVVAGMVLGGSPVESIKATPSFAKMLADNPAATVPDRKQAMTITLAAAASTK